MCRRVLLALVGLALAAAQSASHYEVLGVARDADTSSIKKAYYKLALSNHPDKQPSGARKGKRSHSSASSQQERMEQINEAWSVLGDTEQRARYDRELQLRDSRPSGGGTRGFAQPAEPLASVHIYCTLRELAGVSVFRGIGRVDDSGRRRGLPPFLPVPPMYLPAGSASGDRLLASFQGGAATIEFVLHARTDRRFSRIGDDLYVLKHVPAWHNWRAPRLRVQDLMGVRHEISRKGERLRGKQEVRTVRNAGFPVKGGGREMRGNLRVEVRRRSLSGSLVRRGLLFGLCGGVGSVARHLRAVRGTERATKYRRLTQKTVHGGGRVFGKLLDLANLFWDAF